jgi:hypothetical protein
LDKREYQEGAQSRNEHQEDQPSGCEYADAERSQKERRRDRSHHADDQVEQLVTPGDFARKISGSQSSQDKKNERNRSDRVE